MFSPDGTQFWDGHSWQSALSPDGNWRWDGTQWVAVTAGAGAAPGSTTLRVPVAVAPGTTQPMQAVKAATARSWRVVTANARALTPAAVPAVGSPAAAAGPGLAAPDRRKGGKVIGYRKEPTAWTQPLVVFASIYFSANALYILLVAAAMSPVYREHFYSLARASGNTTSAQAETLATTATTIVIAFVVIVALLGLLLGILSFRRIPLIYTIQMVLNFFALLSFMFALSTPAEQRVATSPGLFWSSTLFDAAGAVLFFLMVFARRAYGAWGLRRVPVYAER
jgi:hypothetical protein